MSDLAERIKNLRNTHLTDGERGLQSYHRAWRSGAI